MRIFDRRTGRWRAGAGWLRFPSAISRRHIVGDQFERCVLAAAFMRPADHGARGGVILAFKEGAQLVKGQFGPCLLEDPGNGVADTDDAVDLRSRESFFQRSAESAEGSRAQSKVRLTWLPFAGSSARI